MQFALPRNIGLSIFKSAWLTLFRHYCMEQQIVALSNYLDSCLRALDSLQGRHRRLIIGLSGIPGSGKTTLASLIVKRINSLSYGPHPAILVGMDGWHYSRAQLNQFEDPAEAHKRRGAPFTFDAEAFVKFVSEVRNASTSDTIKGPTFAHEKKDPVPDQILIQPHHRLVLFEGIYLPLTVEPWCRAHEHFDEIWLLECDRSRARERLIERHVRTGVTKNALEAAERAETNDLPNGDYLLAHIREPTRRIPSIEDQELQGAEKQPGERLS